MHAATPVQNIREDVSVFWTDERVCVSIAGAHCTKRERRNEVATMGSPLHAGAIAAVAVCLMACAGASIVAMQTAPALTPIPINVTDALISSIVIGVFMLVLSLLILRAFIRSK
ncbi:unnamed protein product (mitochondrion) [Plasmodiophora brassicae]|uniref:Uncharacterized protein n=1 Tax=Plasmodiophora brassicae TaxID=37360 RepID=A0A3P3Y688_PLABS|nr:unnamed protein product [Plasmodiophora brassicae]